MPMTAQYLYDSGWFELKGYNKVSECNNCRSEIRDFHCIFYFLIAQMDDNTFPNLMAILNGYNQTTSYELCDPKHVGQLGEFKTAV